MPTRRVPLSPQRFRLAVLFSVWLILPPGSEAYGQRRQAGGDTCQLTSGGESTVLAIAGPLTLRLADGRFVRLAEVATPSPAQSAGYDPSSAATAFLRSAALGRRVEVKYSGASRDRYGVYTAHVFVVGEAPLWLQEGLVSAGLAQAFPQADNHSCSRQLMSFEAAARDEKRGHWGIALFKVLAARDARSISNLVQTYQIVEGKIDRITQTGGRAVLHFGAEGKFDFTAVIEPAARKQLGGQALEQWQARFVRVRGWIERKKGPEMSITQPEEIELIGDQPDDRAPRKSK